MTQLAAKRQQPRVVVLETSHGAAEMLERRVGGILQGIASVRACSPSALQPDTADVIVCYANAVHLTTIRERCPGARIVEANLALLPQGVRRLQEINRPCDAAVVAEHQRCANYFLSEILQAGIIEPRFHSTTIAQMAQERAEVFIVSEEIADLVPTGFAGRVLTVPRSIPPYSASQLIRVVFETR